MNITRTLLGIAVGGLCAALGSACAENFTPSTAAHADISAAAATAVSGPAFQVGEKLTYQIFWGPLVVGRATLEVAGIEPVDGHACYHLVATAKTSGLADLMYPVDNCVESWLDMEALFARKYNEHRAEGKSRHDDTIHYDYVGKQTVIHNNKNGKERRFPLTEPVQDVVSSMYFIRMQPLKIDAAESFTINAGDTNLVVSVTPDQRKKLWVRPLGDVPALRLEPKPTLNIVSSKKGRMWFWVSDDARRLPLLVASDMTIGSAKLVLFKVETTSAAGDKPQAPVTNFAGSAPPPKPVAIAPAADH